MSYLSNFDFNFKKNSLNEELFIKPIINKELKPNETYNNSKIKQINNFYGYQCKNCLFEVWRDKNTFDNKLVQLNFCCTNCKYSYEFKKNKNYSIKLNYNSNSKLKSNSI